MANPWVKIVVLLIWLVCPQVVHSQKLYETLRGVKVESNQVSWNSKPGLDTTLNRFHYYMPIYSNGYAFQGNLGLAAKPLKFEANAQTGFQYGPEYHQYFQVNADSIKYTMPGDDPYTNIFYMAGGQSEQFVCVKHAQELGKGFNFGLDYRVMNAEGQYERQDNKQSNFSAYIRYITPNQRYGATLNYFGNKFLLEENGGLSSDTALTAEVSQRVLFPSPEFYSVSLYNETNRFRSKGHFFEQYWQMGKTDSVFVESDSTSHYQLSSSSRIYHRVDHRNQGYSFLSESTDSDTIASAYFDRLFEFTHEFPTAVIWDSVQWRSLSTTIGWTTESRHDTLTSWWEKNGLFINSSYSWARDSVLQVWDTTVVNSRTLDLQLVKSIPKSPFYVNGYFQSSSSAELDKSANYSLGMSFIPDSSAHQANVSWSRFSRPVEQVFRKYVASRFSWDNDFLAVQGMSWKANYGHKLWRTNLRLQSQLLTNWTYFSEFGQPRQYNGDIRINRVEITQPAFVGPFYFRLKGMYQKSSKPWIVAVPQFYGVATVAAETTIFEGELQAQLGVDLTMHSEYAADGYNPITRQFYRQNSVMIGNYPFIDVYFSVAVKRARMFVKWYHINAGLMGDGFYTIDKYPSHFRGFKFGLDWTFWN